MRLCLALTIKVNGLSWIALRNPWIYQDVQSYHESTPIRIFSPYRPSLSHILTCCLWWPTTPPPTPPMTNSAFTSTISTFDRSTIVDLSLSQNRHRCRSISLIDPSPLQIHHRRRSVSIIAPQSSQLCLRCGFACLNHDFIFVLDPLSSWLHICPRSTFVADQPSTSLRLCHGSLDVMARVVLPQSLTQAILFYS